MSSLNLRQAARIVGVHPRTITRWQAAGHIPPLLRRARTRTYIIDSADLDRLRALRDETFLSPAPASDL